MMTSREFNEQYLANREVKAAGPFESMALGASCGLSHVPRIECSDGFSVSIQASNFTYCTPRDDTGPWTKVELGFPSEDMPSLNEYAETPDDHTGTVFAYVPLKKVMAVLDSHGGIKEKGKNNEKI